MIACPSCGTENPTSLKFCGECGTKLRSDAGRELRKTVTVLFADVAGSTRLGEQLDPESLRALMSRYFSQMKAIIEAHGGTVEKFIGDAVMAVFGIPTVHEDDALRAVRAADGIRRALVVLGAELIESGGPAISFRTGVNTGEVVAGDPADGTTLVTGDTVNIAARLEQNAPTGEILLGEQTYRLVRDAVKVEALPPIEAKGKQARVPAYRLIALTGTAAHQRALGTPLVGRQAQLEQLGRAYGRVTTDRTPLLMIVMAPAGVGKSRLVAEFVSSIAGEAKVLKSRCLSYGEGITYWPLRELVQAATETSESDDRDVAVTRLQSLLASDDEGELIARRIGAALGWVDEPAPQEEVFWAARKLLEKLAHNQSLVVVVDDIHWAEQTFLDLLDYTVDLATDAPLLIICTARPELLEKRPASAGGRPDHELMRLEPLTAAVAVDLFDVLPGGQAVPVPLRKRIIEAAEGNPLYLEEMLSMLVDDGRLSVDGVGGWSMTSDSAEIAVPPTISALLGARIDALPRGERAVAERAAVIGRVFELEAVRELTPEGQRPAIGTGVLALVRKELIRRERAELGTSDGFKFRHLLIRDAAYKALPKTERAALHERFADWLVVVTGKRAAEFDEIIGYHLEQAQRYLTELGIGGGHAATLAARAGERLADAGFRAAKLNDLVSARGLLARAVVLLPANASLRASALIQLARLERLTGGDSSTEQRLLATALEMDLDDSQRLRALILESDLSTDRGEPGDVWIERLSRAIAAGRGSIDPETLGEALYIQSALEWHADRPENSSRTAKAAEEALRNSADMSLRGELAVDGVIRAMSTETPVSVVLADIEAYLRVPLSQRFRAELDVEHGRALILSDTVDAGVEEMEEGIATLRDLGLSPIAFLRLVDLGVALKRAGRWQQATGPLLQAFEYFKTLENDDNSFAAPHLAHVWAVLGDERAADALEMAGTAAFSGFRAPRHFARARLLSREGQHEAAIEELARTPQPGPLLRAEYQLELSAALEAAGSLDAALSAAEAAIPIAESKGATIFATRARAVIERLADSPAVTAVPSTHGRPT